MTETPQTLIAIQEEQLELSKKNYEFSQQQRLQQEKTYKHSLYQTAANILTTSYRAEVDYYLASQRQETPNEEIKFPLSPTHEDILSKVLEIESFIG